MSQSDAMTYTYAVLEISSDAYEEIKAKLQKAGYDHAFHDRVIDMHGIALAPSTAPDWLECSHG